MSDTINICGACLRKHRIQHDERSVDIITGCDVCNIPDATMTMSEYVFNQLKEVNDGQQHRSAEANAGDAQAAS